MRVGPLVMAPTRTNRRPIAALLLLLYLPACTSWKVGRPTPEEFLENEQPDNVRVTQTDGSRVELMSPEVRADSLVGTAKEGTVHVVSIPLSGISFVEVKKVSAVKNLFLILGLAMVVGAVVECWDGGCGMEPPVPNIDWDLGP